MTRDTPVRASKSPGFTLIELMVVIAITGSVVGGLNLLSLDARAHLVRRNALLTQTLRAQAAINALRQELKSAHSARLVGDRLTIETPQGPAIAEAKDGRLTIRSATGKRRHFGPLAYVKISRESPRLFRIEIRFERVVGRQLAKSRVIADLAMGL
ncbi:MAG: prepilin-type N-terminal cleavage/methylation domain-containing protein [Deltaproteobacteria bacterium]|nr:prepilin-type N-terminal cleavage/methylation domain-containing protein [Deltaproteobacteria bacterium]